MVRVVADVIAGVARTLVVEPERLAQVALPLRVVAVEPGERDDEVPSVERQLLRIDLDAALDARDVLVMGSIEYGTSITIPSLPSRTPYRSTPARASGAIAVASAANVTKKWRRCMVAPPARGQNT